MIRSIVRTPATSGALVPSGPPGPLKRALLLDSDSLLTASLAHSGVDGAFDSGSCPSLTVVVVSERGFGVAL